MQTTATIKSYRDLIAWRKAFDTGLEIVRVARTFPVEERFALAAQLRRSAVSVPSNIAEGFGRGSRVDYIRFLHIARGSLFELSTQLEFARELGYLKSDDGARLKNDLEECERVLCGLIRALESKTPSDH